MLLSALLQMRPLIPETVEVPRILKNSKVVGLNTAIIMEASNIAFITPIHIVKSILPQLLKGKEVKLSTLGAYIQKNSAGNSHYLNQNEVKGIIINKVLNNSGQVSR